MFVKMAVIQSLKNFDQFISVLFVIDLDNNIGDTHQEHEGKNRTHNLHAEANESVETSKSRHEVKHPKIFDSKLFFREVKLKLNDSVRAIIVLSVRDFPIFIDLQCFVKLNLFDHDILPCHTSGPVL